MNHHLLDRLGEWNPQFVREIKGRLTGRNVTFAVGLSVLTQLVIFLTFISQIPRLDKEFYSGHYFGSYCLSKKGNYCLAVDWIEWWKDLNHLFYWIFPLALLSGGVYLLIADLAREERRGTLSFIRVSPQTSQSILIGKLLGVPVLIYLAVAIALPMYAISATLAQIPLLEVFSFYLLLAALCSLFYSAAVLFALMGGQQAFVGAGITLGMVWLVMNLKLNDYDWGPLQWFDFTFNRDNLLNLQLFAVGNCVIWTYWIWQGLHRRFRNPTATIISKKQSYALVFCWNFLLLGFVTPSADSGVSTYLWFNNLYLIATLNLFLFLGLIAALSPPRQPLLDWARYAHQANRQSVLQDLIWGEKSPAPVAIAICAIITALIFLPWVLLWPLEMISKLQAISAIGIYVILTAIYAVLAQIMLLLKSKKGALWATSVVAAAIGVPLLILALVGGQPETIPELFLLSIFSLSGLEYATTTPIFMAFLAHFAILAGLSLKLRQQLNLTGESATKALLMGRKVS